MHLPSAQGANVCIRSMRLLPSHANGRRSRARAKQRKKLWPVYARGLRMSRASCISLLKIVLSARATPGPCAATAAAAAPAWRGGCAAVARGSAADIRRSDSPAGGPGKAGGPGLLGASGAPGGSGGAAGSGSGGSGAAATVASPAAAAGGVSALISLMSSVGLQSEGCTCKGGPRSPY